MEPFPFDRDSPEKVSSTENIGSTKEQAQAKSKEANKRRVQSIRTLMDYYGVNYPVAQAKYSELKNSGELLSVLTLANEGKKTETPICPRCSGEMKKKHGRLGEFWGCIRWPECNGLRPIKSEIEKITAKQAEETQQKLKTALKYIEAIGGVDEARRWVGIAAQSLGEGKI